MKDGFVRVAAVTPTVTVADCISNRMEIERRIRQLKEADPKVIVFPELCLTGYECRDLFWQSELLRSAMEQLAILAEHTADVDALLFVGLPVEACGKLYNCAAALCHGRILGFVPKTNLPSYDEFYEARNFEPAPERTVTVRAAGREVPLGTRLLFQATSMPRLIVGAEICEDLWVPCPPSVSHIRAGATVIVNLSASDELVGKDSYRRTLVKSHSGSCICGYIYATAGEGESSTDLVFGGQNMIAENGTLLAEAKLFANETVCADLDVDRLVSERRRMTSFPAQYIRAAEPYTVIPFQIQLRETALIRAFDPHPFVPSSKEDRDRRCEEILMIQAMGLKKRLAHTHAKTAVIGISGGLDSTLALLVTARAFDLLGLPRSQILSVTMPCFGTTDRTYRNAVTLTGNLGATLREVNLREAVLRHFGDIGQDPEVHDVTYENGQARERTQVLMDLANQSGGLVIGTGDLSELALGWATYNGDHMSMYAVNASVPKTLVRHLVRYYADTCGDATLRRTLLDILATPVSPELLPPSEGEIAQKTEDLVGPYELHDFFLYYMLRLGFPPAKIYRIAAAVFADGNSHAGAGSEGEAEEPVSGSAAAGMTEDDTDGTSGDGAAAGGTAPHSDGTAPHSDGTSGNSAAAGDAEDDPDHTLGAGHYDRATILRWLKIFYRRFFAQQFKRSCLPDGPKVGTVAVSPRGNLRMPSDASARIWLEELEKLGEA